MNSKTIIKRTLPLIIALLVIIIVAVSCTIFSKDKKDPTISNPEGIFISSANVSIKNDFMYKELKTEKGLDTILMTIDQKLLSTVKNKDGVSFFAAVSEDRVDEAIEKNIFPNGKSDDEEENAEAIEEWKLNFAVAYGLRSEEARRDFYRLNLAKEDYTRFVIQTDYEASIANNNPDDNKSYDDDLIKADDITTYYNNNYKNSYWAIIVPFNTVNEAKAALSQLKIVIKENESGQEAWLWGDTEEELSEEEVKKAFIDLYNNVYSYKAEGYPNANPLDNIVLGTNQYLTIDGKITFNTEYDSEDEDSKQNLLYYTSTDLNQVYYRSATDSMEYYLKSLSTYSDENATFNKVYSVNPKTWTNASKCYFVFKIAVEDAEKKADVEAEILEKLLDNKNNDAYKKTAMNNLRKENNILFYDSQIEAQYISSIDTSHEKTKKASKDVVVSIDDLEITSDELFSSLAKRYGVLSSFDFFANEYILYSEYNNIYDVVNKKVLDEKEWEKIEDQVAFVKSTFKANGYYNEGYTVSYGWDNFLRSKYNVANSEELKIYFLRQAVVMEFVDAVTETDILWDDIYLPHMEDAYEKFLSATGYHLLIYKYDDEGNIVDPEEWTAYEKSVAEELYDSVLARLTTSLPSKYQTLLETYVVTEFKNAPKFVATLDQDPASQPVYSPLTPWVLVDGDDYLYSKAKTAGLDLKVESLTISQGMMVKPFEDAVRAIWDKAEENELFGSEAIIYDKTYDDYLVTEFGYHVYINLTTTNRTTIKVSGEDVVVPVPNKDSVLAYEKNDADPDLTSLIKKSITTFFTPIKTEVKGEYFYKVKLNEYFIGKLAEITYGDPSLNANGELEEIINFQIDLYSSGLNYIKKPGE